MIPPEGEMQREPAELNPGIGYECLDPSSSPEVPRIAANCSGNTALICQAAGLGPAASVLLSVIGLGGQQLTGHSVHCGLKRLAAVRGLYL